MVNGFSALADPERVLVVDDDPSVRFVMLELLADHGHVAVAASGTREAHRLLDEEQFALILSDVNMPDGSGLELVRHVTEEHPGVAAVMVTGVDDPRLAEAALELGAYGYLLKPFGGLEVAIQVSNALRRRGLEQDSARRGLGRALAEPALDLRHVQEETIRRFAAAIEVRNRETSDHVERVGDLCALLAGELGWGGERCEALRLASVLHDVGKIAIPDRLLLKPGPLTVDERRQMERHTTIGYRILAGSPSVRLTLAAEIALHHHERWDGFGYPDGLSGDAISLEARIVSVVDVFDALTSDRPYRAAYGLEQAMTLMADQRGRQFDAIVFDAFVGALPRVAALWHGGGERRRAAG